MLPFKQLTLVVAVAAALSACGGGGDSTTTTTPVTPAATPAKGLMIDGYISGATVFCDVDGDGIQGTGEAAATTDGNGAFTITAGCASSMVGTGGTVTDTGNAFTGQMKTPAGGTVISPLSTLISPELTIAMLAAQLNAPAGTDVTTLNIADGTHPEMLKKSLAVQQTINNIAQLIQAAGGTDKLAAIYASVAAAFGKSLAVAAATPGAAPFISSTGTVNAAAVASFVSALPAVVALNIPADTLTAAVASIAAEAQQFVSASDAAIGDLTKDLQSTTKPPVYTAPAPAPAPGPAETTNFVSLASDSLIIDGQSLTLATLAQGATVTGLTDVGFSLNVTGTPAADVTASVAIELAEQGGTGRLFQFMIDKVSMKLTAGQLAVTLADGAVVYVHGISDNHSEVSLTLTDLSFNPVNAGSNTFTLNYANMVNKVLGSGDSNFNGTARTFLDMKGTFLVRVILSNVNLRHADGSAISTQSITLPNAPAAVVGDGVSGLIVLN